MALNVQGAQPAKASWMSTGSYSEALAKQEKADQEARKESQGKAFRFFMKDGESAQITFVDGDLQQSPAGMVLLPSRFYEHGLMLHGKVQNYVCPTRTLPSSASSGGTCPLCESGDHPSLVAVFTVIDHREYKGAKGVYKDTVKLLVAKSQSFEQLNMLAQKIGGLAGSRWTVSRAGDKSPQIGNNWFPEGKTPIPNLQALYQRETTDPKSGMKTKASYFLPLDYDNEVVFRTGDQLRQFGLGKPGSVPSGFGGQTQALPPGGQSYDQQL